MTVTRWVRYAGEYAALRVALILFGVLPVTLASAIGGMIGRCVGPLTGRHQSTLERVQHVLNIPSAQARTIVMTLWGTIGRMIAEYQHLRVIARSRIEWQGLEHIPAPEQRGHRPLVFVSGHMGNWEVMLPAYHAVEGEVVSGLLRTPNNPFVARLLERARFKAGVTRQIAKSRAGNRELVKCLQEGGILGLLLDQKFNEGEAVPFFGRPAMMATSLMDLSQKCDAFIVPVRCERLPQARFRLTVFPALDNTLSAYEASCTLNHMFEGWIRDRPDEWLWTHNRWESGRLKELDPVDQALLG